MKNWKNKNKMKDFLFFRDMSATLKINLCMSCPSYFLAVYLFEVSENASKQNVSRKISFSTISKRKREILDFFQIFFLLHSVLPRGWRDMCHTRKIDGPDDSEEYFQKTLGQQGCAVGVSSLIYHSYRVSITFPLGPNKSSSLGASAAPGTHHFSY